MKLPRAISIILWCIAAGVAVLILLIAAFLFLPREWIFAPYSQALLPGMRHPNRTEEFYAYAAQELAEPALCYKIPWTVQSTGAFTDAQQSYYRSVCYDIIAARTQTPSLCWRVRHLGPYSLFDDRTSIWTCWEHATHRIYNSGNVSLLSPEALVAAFAQMGYDPDTLHLEGVTPPIISLESIYWNLPSHPGIMAQIEKATSGHPPATSPRDIEDAAYLDDVAAITTNDSQWCLRIPAELRLTGENATFRNWCLFTLATNTKRAKLCSTLPTVHDQTDPQMTLQSQCIAQANSTGNDHYVPELPAGKDRIRELLGKINYEIPRAKDLPASRLADEYDHFLYALNQRTDPQHLAARQRFLARVQHLPDAN